MKILVITQMYPQPDDEGGNKVTHTVEYFAKEWVESGNEVVVFHCSSKFPFALYLTPRFLKNYYAYKTSTIIPSIKSRKKLYRENLGIKIHRIPMFKFFPGRNYSKKTINDVCVNIEKIIEQNGFIPDLVLGHFANPSLEIVSILSEKYKAMSSIVFHGDCNEKTIVKYRIIENIKKIKAVGVRSNCEALKVKKLLNLQFDPFVCCSGVPNELVKIVNTECVKHSFTSRIKYLYVGSIIARKHLDSVIIAFSNVSRENDTLEIIGAGPEEDKLKKLVIKKKIKNVYFLGRLPRNEVIKKMEESNILTLISDNEVYGMVYIEAMLKGCLTIASKEGGFDGIIRNYENGFLCSPGDTNELIDLYKSILNLSYDARNEIGNKAIKTALKFSEKDVANNYLKDIVECNRR